MRIRRIILLLLALGVIVAGLWKWNDSRARAARRLAAWEARQEDEAANHPQSLSQTDIYPVVYPIPQPEIGPVDEQAWIESIRRVGPNRWYVKGGPVHLEAVPGAIVVAQTAQGHKAIRGTINRLSALQNRPTAWTPVPLFPPFGAVEDRILAALAQPSSIECVEKPLVEVLNDLSKRHGIPIRILNQKLEEAGIEPDTPISKQLDGIALRSLLETLLSELELSFLVREGELLITTPEDAESQLVLVAYPVHDLVGLEDHSATGTALTDLIESTIAPQGWDSVGGPGWQCKILDGWLIVSQTQYVHEVIGQLLQQLRSALHNDDDQMAFRARRPWSSAEERLYAALGQVMKFQFNETPLNQVVDFLRAEQPGVRIVLNSKRLEESGIKIDVPITCDLPPATLGEQLDLILKQHGLKYEIRDDLIHITSEGDADSRLEMVVYDTRLLIDPEFGILDKHQLRSLIVDLIEPDSWVRAVGETSIRTYRGLLFVNHTDTAQLRIERLLHAMETHCMPGMPSVPPLVRIEQPAAGKLLEEKLQTVVDIDYCGVPVRRVLEDLAARLDFPVWTDEVEVSTVWPGAPSAFGFPSPGGGAADVDYPNVLDAPVSLSAKGITLSGALDRLLRPCGLHASPRGHVLWVTADSYPLTWRPEVRLYNLGALSPHQDPQVVLDTLRALQIVPISQPSQRPYRQPLENVRLVAGSWLAARLPPEHHAVLEDWLIEQLTGNKPQRAVEREALLRELEVWNAIERDFEAARLQQALPFDNEGPP